MERRELLRGIPKMDELLASRVLTELSATLTGTAVKEAARRELDELRRCILEGRTETLPSREDLCVQIAKRAEKDSLPSLRRVINGTGVVLHTNLGRACLGPRAVRAVCEVARGYSTLEYNVEEGRRGSRHDHVEKLLTDLTGAEAAMVVNNNAGAVLLILSALGKGGEVVASRGELVEIGGSFRIPEIMIQCGCTLREVGATNKTHLRDYESAIGPETRALLKVHPSNSRIVSFSESVPLEDLTILAHSRGLPVIQDLGSGCLTDLNPMGIHDEPVVQHSVKAGVDVISFSGDKMLGGPQAGIIVGRREIVEKLKRHPLARALRVDKMTLAALQETLICYTDPVLSGTEIPVLSLLSASDTRLREKAELLRSMLEEKGVQASVVKTESQVGGGSAPTQLLPSWAVVLEGGEKTADDLEKGLRRRRVPVIGRISHERCLLDVRTLQEEDFGEIAAAAAEVLA